MQLTELLEMYKPIGEVRTKTILELYMGVYDEEDVSDLFIRRTKKGNTILQEEIGNGELLNTYVHHSNGPGRLTIKSRVGKGYLDEYDPWR